MGLLCDLAQDGIERARTDSRICVLALLVAGRDRGDGGKTSDDGSSSAWVSGRDNINL